MSHEILHFSKCAPPRASDPESELGYPRYSVWTDQLECVCGQIMRYVRATTPSVRTVECVRCARVHRVRFAE